MSEELRVSSSQIATLTQDPGIYSKEDQQRRLRWAQLGQAKHRMIQAEAVRYAGQTLGIKIDAGSDNGWEQFMTVDPEVECWSDLGGVICTAVIDAVLNKGDYCVEIKTKSGDSLKKHHLLQLVINGRLLFDHTNKYSHGIMHLYDLNGGNDKAFIYPNCGYQHWDRISQMAYLAATVYSCQEKIDYIKKIKKSRTLLAKNELISGGNEELKYYGQTSIEAYKQFMGLYKEMRWQIGQDRIIYDVL